MAKRKTPSARQLLSLQKAGAPGNGAVEESTQGVPAVVSSADAARQRTAEAAYYRAENRGFAPGREHVNRLARKHGKAKALTILAHRLGRAVYHMLRRGEAFDNERFLTTA